MMPPRARKPDPQTPEAVVLQPEPTVEPAAVEPPAALESPAAVQETQPQPPPPADPAPAQPVAAPLQPVAPPPPAAPRSRALPGPWGEFLGYVDESDHPLDLADVFDLDSTDLVLVARRRVHQRTRPDGLTAVLTTLVCTPGQQITRAAVQLMLNRAETA